jgi:hypothetical protein
MRPTAPSRARGQTAAALSVVLLAALLLAPSSASALDVADGKVKLTLVEGTGRFTLSTQNSGGGGVYLPLLATQDPRTSVLSIVYGNKIYRMGDSSEFKETAEKVQGGARFIWRSAFLQVTETFTLIPAADSSVSSGVRIDLSLRNLTEQEISVGARFLFDTYLGEPGNVHFRTSALAQVNRELTLTPADKTTWWMSPLANDKNQFGLQVMMAGPGITIPDRVVFANWKRLSDSSWAYDTSAARNFSLLPYSVNDSAAAQYYEARPVPRSSELIYTLAMGTYSKAGYSGLASGAASAAAAAPAPAADFPSSVMQSLAQGRNAADEAQAARADLASVNAILAEIDARIGASASMSDEELALIESALRDLKGRAGRFGTASAH